MPDDHVIVESIDPAQLASAVARRPGMYMGAPETFERAAAYVLGVEAALTMRGAPTPLTEQDHALLAERPAGPRSREEHLADIQRLLPALTALFEAAKS